jgi:soluble lytic murein transglycosylase-like protein
MVVPAVRLERVVADEVEEIPRSSPDYGNCPADWSDDPLPRGIPFSSEIRSAARAANLNPRLLAALVKSESNFDPTAVSRAGAKGLTQLMPSAAADHGVADVFDPAANLAGGASHLRAQIDRFGEIQLALAAYNAGATTVKRHGGVPPYKETQDYVRRVLESFCPMR